MNRSIYLDEVTLLYYFTSKGIEEKESCRINVTIPTHESVYTVHKKNGACLERTQITLCQNNKVDPTSRNKHLFGLVLTQATGKNLKMVMLSA